jgi:arsenate reductase (thioredoxin)
MNRVLFLCKDNTIFSPIAEGYCKSVAGEDTEVYSAGIEHNKIDSFVVKMMKEDGIDLSKFKSHLVHDYRHIDFDYIITFDAVSEEESHHFPSKSIKYHYDLDRMLHENTLEEDKAEMFQTIREKIKKTIKAFVKEHLTKD